jgi:MFS family permease
MYGANIHLTGNIKWRLPLWLQILCPGLACLGSWFLPESPRWQIAQGKQEEAREFIVKHHANGDADHPIVAIEMQEIEESLAEVRSRSAWACFDLRSLFKSRARLYRVMLVITMGWFGQFSGNNVVSYYLPIMVENVGITETNMVLLLNAIYAVTGWIAATAGGKTPLAYTAYFLTWDISPLARHRRPPQNAHGLLPRHVCRTGGRRWYSCSIRTNR